MKDGWNRPRLAAGLMIALLAVPGASLAQTPDNVRNHINSKSGLVSGLAARLEASEQQLNALKAELQAKDQALASLKVTLEQEQKRLSQIAAQDAAKDQRLAEAEAALATLKTSVAAREADLTAMAEKEKALVALQARFEEQKSLVDGLNNRLQEQDGLIAELQSQPGTGNEETDRDASGSEAPLDSRSTLSDLQADLDAALYMVRERDAEIDRMRTDLQTAKSVNLENRKGIESLEFHRLLLGGGLLVALIGLILSFRRRR